MTGAFLPHEGRYLRIYNQAHTLANSGYNVTIIAWDRLCNLPQRINVDGIDIIRIQHRAPRGVGPRNFRNIWKYNRIAQRMLIEARPDCIHCFNIDTIHAGLKAANILKCKTILDMCEPDYYRGFWKGRYNWLLYFIDRYEMKYARPFNHVFVHNEYQVNKYHSANIRNVTRIGSYPNRSSIVSDLKGIADTDNIVIGRLGSIWKNNCIEEFLSAISMLNNNNQRFRIFLAGKVFDNYQMQFNKLKSKYTNILSIQGSYDNSEIGSLYENIDVSIIVYNKRHFGNITPTKLFESFAHGVPVIVNDVGEMAKIVTEGKCGVVVDESDIDSISNGISDICSDRDTYRKMSENCLRLAESTYCWEANSDQFLLEYENVLGE